MALASRTRTESDDEAIPQTDPGDTSTLLLERLQAYKHACGYLENYIAATDKAQKVQSKEYEKILKTVSEPLREGRHFDQQLGGVAGLFENIRSNTQGIANLHLETEKTIKSSVLPVLERLHTEIKHKSKELSKGTVKGSKEVDKARSATQKHIELLGQHSGASAASAGKVETANDPYLLKRGVQHRLHRQVQEENNNRADLLAVQDSFGQFEAHVLATFQQALSAFFQAVGGECDRQRALYAEVVHVAQRIPPDFEWKGFIHRNSNTLINPDVPQRTVSNISYPNQDDTSTKALIAGTLERKSRAVIKGWNTSYYAISPASYLHEFKSDDIVSKDALPELSLYLPDCTIGAIEGSQFSLKGKDASKGKVGSAMAMSHEMTFRASSTAEAEKWYAAICQAAGTNSGATATTTAPPAHPGPAATSTTSATTTAQQASYGTSSTAVQNDSYGSAAPSTTPYSSEALGSATVPGVAPPQPGAVPQAGPTASGVGGVPGQY